MLTAGIDVGSKNVQVVVLLAGDVVGRASAQSGFEQEAAARSALQAAAGMADVSEEDLDWIAVTGVGRRALSFVREQVTEVAADAKGAHLLFPDIRTVVDVGADSARVVRMDASGKVLDFAVNERCAAGAGAFVEAMSRALEVTLEEFASMSTQSRERIAMNAQCAVFAESEVVSLIHSQIPRPDIARAVHDAMAGRVSSLARRAGIETPVRICGGVAHNVGFVKCLQEALGLDALPSLPDPEYVGALGAAVLAAEKLGGAAAHRGRPA